MITKWKYLNSISCGLAQEMVAPLRYGEKKLKNLPHKGLISNLAAYLL